MQQQIADICLAYKVLDLYVFGSRSQEIASRVQSQPVSSSSSEADVDLGILPADMSHWGPDMRVRFTMELEDLLEVRRVDLVLLPEAEPYLALDVIRGELLYTQDQDRQARYELYVLRRAGDLLPFKRERTRMILEEGMR